VSHDQKPFLDRNGNTVEKCCKNCGHSYGLRTDSGIEHKCNVITCGEIKSKKACIEKGFKWFDLHEKFIYGTYEEQEKLLLEQRKKLFEREQEKKNKELVEKRGKEHLRRILFDDHYLDEVVRLAEEVGYIKVVHGECPDRREQPELFEEAKREKGD
jgi:hypothetical protein